MNEWGTVTLADIADIRFSNVDKKSLAGEKSVRLCNYMDTYSNNYITADLPFMEATATALEIERFKVEKGDNIITKDSETPDDIGIPAVVIDDIPNLICGYHLALIKPKRDKVDPIYLSKQLGSKQSAIYFSRRANGSTRYGLSSSAIASIKIPLAPFVEQLRIADVLFTLDTAIEKTEAIITKYQQIKAGLMHDLFTRGVTADGKLRPPCEQAPELYQETPIGRIPKEWVLSRCAQLFTIDSGITLGPHRRPVKRPHPYLRVANIHRDEIRLDDVALLEALPGEIEYCLKKFDLLVVEGHANRSEIGRCAMVLDDAEGMLFQNHLFRMRANNLNSHYALLWMNSHHAQRYWESACATSSGLNTINRKMLAKMPVGVPAHNEQKQIADVSSAIRQMLTKETGRLRKLQTQKCGLMSDLLTGKVRVKLDTKTQELVCG